MDWDIFYNAKVERLRPAARFLKEWEISYDIATKNWLYPYPELKGIKKGGVRGYVRLVDLIHEEYLDLSLMVSKIGWGEIKELENPGEIILHDLGLVKN